MLVIVLVFFDNSDMYYFFMIIIFLLIMIAIFIGISYLISLYGGVHYVGSGDNIYRRALKLASLKSGDTFIELGSGYGKGLLIAAENDLVQAVGVEISPFHYLISRLKTHKKRNIKIVLADYRKISFRGAKVVYCYLLPKQLKY